MGGAASTRFGAKTTAEEVATAFTEHAKGKYIIVTGGSGGLGLETARVLCKHGAHVTITCRTEKQGQDVLKTIKDEQGENASINFGLMTLDDLTTVKSFAEGYIQSGKPLNILINNAGVMANPYQLTKQGFESQFGVNHVGHFYLTKLLLPLLNKSGTPESKSRVIAVASLAGYLYAPEDGIYFDDLDGKVNYNKWHRYGQSKLANALFANELTRRAAADNQNVIAVSLHPGVILASDLMRHNNLLVTVWENIQINWSRPGKIWDMAAEAQKSIAQGAATSVLTALDPSVVGGQWYCDCNATTEFQHPKATDEATAKRLWDVTEDLIKPFL